MIEAKLTELVEEIANRTSVSAYQILADCLLYRVDTEGKPAKLLEIQTPLLNQLQMYAQAGNAMCQAFMAVIYIYGINGFSHNYTKGVELAKRSAGLGEAMGEVALGFAYILGQGIAKDEERALYWFKLAEAKNNPYALCNLGWMYDAGIAGLKVDKTMAFRYFRASAEQANSYGIFNVGLCYEKGAGVSQDYSSAISWYQKSAEKGNALAQGSLGRMFEFGVGIEANFEEAIKWYLRASWSGRAEFQKYEEAINRLRRDGQGELIDKIKKELNL